jgi:hypothetical protein
VLTVHTVLVLIKVAVQLLGSIVVIHWTMAATTILALVALIVIAMVTLGAGSTLVVFGVVAQIEREINVCG